MADGDTPRERAAAKTLPPDLLRVADPPGPIYYAEVFDSDGLAGWVWCTISALARPRAGILLVPTSQRPNPSIEFQTELGEVVLRIRDSSRTVALDFLNYLAETRDGQAVVSIYDVRSATNLAQLRSMAGYSD